MRAEPMHDQPRRLPISTRHAFALALDLAVRRDPLHSLVVPLLLSTPWSLAIAILPRPSESQFPALVVLASSVALLGDFLVYLLITGMLRFRARSVFNTPHDQIPAPAWECYAQSVRRIPWLFVTEVVRNLALAVGALFLVVPAVFLGYRLSFATEAVVLTERDLASSFRRSFHITQRRFERWFELILGSGLMVLGVTFVVAVLSVFVPGPSMTFWAAALRLLFTLITPVIQYGWTFFYLRLVEIDEPGVEVGPAYARVTPGWSPMTRSAPALTLVEPAGGVPASPAEREPDA